MTTGAAPRPWPVPLQVVAAMMVAAALAAADVAARGWPSAAVRDPWLASRAAVDGWPRRPLVIDARHAAAAPAAGEVLPLTLAKWDDQLPALIERWQPGLRILVICDDGECHASERVASRLRDEVGLPDVYVLHGGWAAWSGR